MAQINIKESNETVLDKKLKKPKKFAVVFYNNDFAPIDFVQLLIMNVFNKTPQEALSLTLTIHKKNKAQIGIYPFDLAEAKQIECLQICEVHNFPIKITLEPV